MDPQKIRELVRELDELLSELREAKLDSTRMLIYHLDEARTQLINIYFEITVQEDLDVKNHNGD